MLKHSPIRSSCMQHASTQYSIVCKTLYNFVMLHEHSFGKNKIFMLGFSSLCHWKSAFMFINNKHIRVRIITLNFISHCCSSWYLKISLYLCLNACLPKIRRWWALTLLESNGFLCISLFPPAHIIVHPLVVHLNQYGNNHKYVTREKTSKIHCQQLRLGIYEHGECLGYICTSEFNWEANNLWV